MPELLAPPPRARAERADPAAAGITPDELAARASRYGSAHADELERRLLDNG